MHRPRLRVAVLTAALLAQGAVAGPGLAQEATPRLEVVADGLNNPRGIDVGPDGTVYVAEAGPAGDEHCVEREGAAEESCMAATARLLAIAPDGEVTEVVSGLPSAVIAEGEASGAADVTVAADGSLYVSIALGATAELRDTIAAEWAPGALLGTVQHVVDGELTEVADLAAWEAANDPNAGQPSTQGEQGAPSNDSNPHGVLVASDGTLLAVDAGGNTVLEIDPDTAEITLRALLTDRFAPAPPFLGLPEGTEIPMQAVPTGLTERAGGEVVVGELTGFPFPVGGAMVHRLTADGAEVHAEGFTNVMDVAELNGELYVLEIAHDSLLAGPAGALVRVRADGTRTVLLTDTLVMPGGLAAGDDGMLYITNHSVGAPGSGTVLRFDPSQAADPDLQSACPPLEVPGSALSDVGGTTHQEAIDCLVWHGVANGYADGSFGPRTWISRGQLSTSVANLIEATGTDLPAGGAGVFSDVDGTTHAAAVNALAAAGIVSGKGDGTFDPTLIVAREQAVSIVAAAYEYITGDVLPAGPDVFDDVSGMHAANVTAAAEAGWLSGTAEATFSPRSGFERGQAASVLARVASDLVDLEVLTLPAE